MSPTEYLETFFLELNRLHPAPGYATYDDSIGIGSDGKLEIRLSLVDWYEVVRITLDPDPFKAAHNAALAATYRPGAGESVSQQRGA